MAGKLTLFDRPYEGDSTPLYEEAFQFLKTGGSAEDRAMAQKLEWDHRVQTVRADCFYEYVRAAAVALGGRVETCPPTENAEDERPLTVRALEQGFREYFTERVRTPAVPDFRLSGQNDRNFIKHPVLTKCELSPDLRLARIINLNPLGFLFENAKKDPELKQLAIVRRWANYRSRNPPTSTSESSPFEFWLDVVLKRRDRVADSDHERTKAAFVEGLLELLNKAVRDLQSGKRSAIWPLYHPTWAVDWKQLQPFVENGPLRWSQLLGVDHFSLPNRWVLLLVYPLASVDVLVRPTVLDTGDWFSCHHPSPRQADLRRGGHPVDLHCDPPVDAPLSEFIHPQIEHQIDHYLRDGKLEKMGETVVRDLDHQRERHRSYLRAIYKTEREPMFELPAGGESA
jgi:hypothetical protein